MSVRVVIACSWLALVACERDGDDRAQVHAQVQAQVELECAAILSCTCSSARATMDDCVAQRMAAMAETIDAAAAHSLVWDQDCADAVLERMQACGVVEVTQRTTCFAEQCAYFVGSVPAMGECEPTESSRADPCTNGSRCWTGHCQSICPGPGELCTGTCPPGYVCAGDVGSFCVPGPGPGASCSALPTSPGCPAGQWCDFAETSMCLDQLPPGSACDRHEMCAGGFCDDGGVCVALPEAGEACASGLTPCALGLRCSESGTCDPSTCFETGSAPA